MLVVASATLAILFVCYSMYQFSQIDQESTSAPQPRVPVNPPQSTVEQTTPPDAISNAASGKRVSIGDASIGQGRKIKISVFAKEGTQARLEIAVKDYTPIEGSPNEFFLREPEIRLRTKDGRTVRVTSNEGVLDAGFIHRPYQRPQEVAWSISTVNEFDENIDRFFEEAAQPFDFIVVRTKDYLNWRYCDTRGGRFTVRLAEQDGRILGYLVLKLADDRGFIVDLLALPGRIDIVRSLIEDGLRIFEEADVATAYCWMISRHPYNEVLRRYGFINSRGGTGFQYRTRSLHPAELDFLRDAHARIHIMFGDSDLA